MSFSWNERYYFHYKPYGIDSRDYYILKNLIKLPKIKFDIDDISWSPDNKYIALSVYFECKVRDNNDRGREVWILNFKEFMYDYPDVETPEFKTINIRGLYCKYSQTSLYAEFITNTSLVISMFADGESLATLWEVTIDGDVVRQLTFE